MTRTNTQLKAAIMRRIYTVWFWRHVAPMLAVEAVLIGAVLIGVLTQISLANIFANAFAASSDAISFVRFFIDNFFVKSTQSQLLVAAWGALIGFFIRDAVSALRKFRDAHAGDWSQRHAHSPL
jgi:hypothetical protein